jgi:hypothetical protein
MISANDVLQTISEIHQYSMLLLELKNATTVGILHSGRDATSYFLLEGSLKPSERGALVRRIYDGDLPQTLKALTVEELIREVEGQKAKHIWLETVGRERKEHGFLSISELKAFLRTNPQS